MITTNKDNIKVGGIIHLIYRVIEEVITMTKLKGYMLQQIPKNEKTGKYYKVKEGNGNDYIYQMISEVYPPLRKE